jgi:hypothetical protein
MHKMLEQEVHGLVTLLPLASVPGMIRRKLRSGQSEIWETSSIGQAIEEPFGSF